MRGDHLSASSPPGSCDLATMREGQRGTDACKLSLLSPGLSWMQTALWISAKRWPRGCPTEEWGMGPWEGRSRILGPLTLRAKSDLADQLIPCQTPSLISTIFLTQLTNLQSQRAYYFWKPSPSPDRTFRGFFLSLYWSWCRYPLPTEDFRSSPLPLGQRLWGQVFCSNPNPTLPQLHCCLVDNLYLTFCNPVDCSPPGSSVYGICQARIPERVAISFSRGSSQPRDRTGISCIAGRFFTRWAIGEVHPVEWPWTTWGSMPQFWLISHCSCGS